MKKIGTLLFALMSTSALAQPVITTPPFVTETLVPQHLYYMAASSCSDSNNGTSPSTPWCTPAGHSLVCGDVIIAASGTYTSDFSSWSTVSTCPSTTKGIDGTGGIYFALLLCGGADVASCVVSCTNGASGSSPCNADSLGGVQAGFDVNKSNWAVSGWTVNGNGLTNATAYEATNCAGVSHHIAFINTVVYNIGQAFTPQSCLNSGDGADYVAVVGMIAQNSAQNDNSICVAAIDEVVPGKFGTSTTDTHYFLYNNYAWNNLVPGCDSQFDGEDYMFDTIDANQVIGKHVLANSIGFYAERYCVNFTYGNTPANVRVYNMTCYDNMQRTGPDSIGAEIYISGASTTEGTLSIFDNIGYQPHAHPGITGTANLYAGAFNPANNLGVGSGYMSGDNNVFKGTFTGPCDGDSCDTGFNVVEYSSTFGTNTYINPDFKNAAHLISSNLGPPSCSGKATTTECVGWNAYTQTMTSQSILDDLTTNATGNCSACVGKGFQLPTTTCTTSGELFNDYPSWLKGMNRAQWNASTSEIVILADLATKPCGS